MRNVRVISSFAFVLVAFVACSTEVVKIGPPDPEASVEPTDPVDAVSDDEDPIDEAPIDDEEPRPRDAGKTPAKDAGKTSPKDASAPDASVVDSSVVDASIVDSSPPDSGPPACGLENATCSGTTCCSGLRCSGNGKCICQDIPCSAAGATCCAGSPYCVAPSGFSLQCSASPGFLNYRCRQTSDCGGGLTCQAGTCKQPCTPSCFGKTCGSDGCGGSCGSCALGQSCSAGTCVTPPPPPVDECNPVFNSGCTPPNECILLANETAKCALLGTGTQGSSCGASSPCDGGYSCFSGTCRKVCTLGSNAACPAATTCKPVTGWTEHGACG